MGKEPGFGLWEGFHEGDSIYVDVPGGEVGDIVPGTSFQVLAGFDDFLEFSNK